MHELAVTQNILEIALRHGQQAQRITDLYLVVGQLSSLVDDCVQFYWDIISRDTPAEGARLHFQRIPAEMRCNQCDFCYCLNDSDDFLCPNCGSVSAQLISGDEFYLESIEVE